MHKNDDAFTLVGKTNTETHAVMNMALHPTVCLRDVDLSRWCIADGNSAACGDTNFFNKSDSRVSTRACNRKAWTQ
jgi:hypothetical protein